MPIDIDGYNETFRAFVDFAKTKEAANEKKAVADMFGGEARIPHPPGPSDFS